MSLKRVFNDMFGKAEPPKPKPVPDYASWVKLNDVSKHELVGLLTYGDVAKRKERYKNTRMGSVWLFGLSILWVYSGITVGWALAAVGVLVVLWSFKQEQEYKDFKSQADTMLELFQTYVTMDPATRDDWLRQRTDEIRAEARAK